MLVMPPEIGVGVTVPFQIEREAARSAAVIPLSAMSLAEQRHFLVLKLAGLAESTSEANRLIEQGGVRVDGERLSDRALKAGRGRTYVIQVGKRKFARVSVQ